MVGERDASPRYNLNTNKNQLIPPPPHFFFFQKTRHAAPCLLVAAFAHPGTHHPLPFRVAWAACVYMEAVSVLPQLRAMQKAKVVEKFTAHYVAALGLSRFISCAHWLLQIMDGRSFLLQAIGSGLWPVMVLLSEVVQTFILADFW